jgi:hypothetical protein
MNPPDPVLERRRVREVTGVFHSRERVDSAANDLLLAGFDRGDIDIFGSLTEVPKRLGPVYVAPEELAHVNRAPRQPFLDRDDLTVLNIVVASLVGSACGLATGFWMLQSGRTEAAAAIAGVLVGLFGAALAFLITARVSREDESLSSIATHRGLVLWVRVRSPEQEDKAQEILLRHGAKAVSVHEIELEKHPDDLPLGSVRPDPWLGDERLGQP